MKKFYGIMMLAMLAVCSIAFVSCGDDDGVSGNSLVGTWRWTDGEDIEEVVFNANGTYAWYEYSVDESRDLDESGTYTVEDNVVTMVSQQSGGASVYRFEISNKTLTLYEKNRRSEERRVGKEC